MDHKVYSKDLYESVPDYRKIVLSKFLNEGDDDFVKSRLKI